MIGTTVSSLIGPPKLATFFAMLGGFVFDGTDKILHCPKFIAPALHHVYIIPTFYFILYLSERVITVMFTNATFGMIVFNCVHIVSTSVPLIAIINIVYRKKQITTLLNTHTESFRKKFYSRKREIILNRGLKTLGHIILVEAILLIIPRIVTFPVVLLRGRLYLPTLVPGDPTNSWYHFLMTLYQVGTSIWHGLISVAFDSLFHTLLVVVITEAKYLTGTLSTIFKCIDFDEGGHLFARYGESADTAPRNSNKDNANIVFQKDDPIEFNRMVESQRKEFRTWLKQYSAILEMAAQLRKWFGPALSGKYAFVATFSCGMILGDVFRKVSGIAVFNNLIAYMAMALFLFASCFYGDQFLEDFTSVPKGALGTNWQLYPLDMKKDLYTIMLVSSKELRIDLAGMFPLTLETFLQIAKLSYSLVLFVIEIG